jgi:hypothetical protein
VVLGLWHLPRFVDGTHAGFQAAFADKTAAELDGIAADPDIPLNPVK